MIFSELKINDFYLDRNENFLQKISETQSKDFWTRITILGHNDKHIFTSEDTEKVTPIKTVIIDGELYVHIK